MVSSGHVNEINNRSLLVVLCPSIPVCICEFGVFSYTIDLHLRDSLTGTSRKEKGSPMELHNPPKLGLPPLMIEKQSSRAEMERRLDIGAFIGSKLLLDKQFHIIFIDITNRSTAIEQNISSMHDWAVKNGTTIIPLAANFNMPMALDWENMRPRMREAVKIMLRPRCDIDRAVPDGDDSGLLRFVTLIAKNHREKFISDILESSRLNSDKLSEFADERHIDLDILTHEVIYVC